MRRGKPERVGISTVIGTMFFIVAMLAGLAAIAQLYSLGVQTQAAAQLGVYNESVRYRYKRLLRRGIVVQAILNYSKLGFNRLILVAAFSPSFRTHAWSILTIMHEFCYVKSFEQTAVEGWFLIQVAVPSELAESCADLFKELESLGMFSHLEVYNFRFVRTPPMKHEYYDFAQETWSYEWSWLQDKVPLVLAREQQKEPYDKIDLLILNELQADANASISKISKRFSIGYRKLIWHYTNHVIDNNLIDGYTVNWTRTNHDTSKEQTPSSHTKYLPICLLLTNSDEHTRLSFMALVQRSPFLGFEASGDHYFASVYLPLETINEFFSRLRDLNIDWQRLRFFIMSNFGLNFSLSCQLFDGATKKWQLNKNDFMQKLESALRTQEDREREITH